MSADADAVFGASGDVESAAPAFFVEAVRNVDEEVTATATFGFTWAAGFVRVAPGL